MHKRNVHVFHVDSQWVVEQDGQANVRTPYPTRFAAVEAAKRMAKQNRSDLVIHRINGSIAERNNYIYERAKPIAVAPLAEDGEEMARA